MHSIGEVGERLRRQTVEIASERGPGSGSGVLWPGAARLIVTNAHVAGDGPVRVRFWDGAESRAQPVRVDAHADLAVLSVNVIAGQTAAVRLNDGVRRGELVIAVGNPLGFTGALSTGIVHAVGPAPGLGKRSWIQAQVRLAPGNSGGPLADAQGRVIGINSMVVSGGLGLAIPAETVSAFLRRRSNPVRLGVTLRPIRGGLLVLEVESGSRAETASLLPGDILVAANGSAFASTADLGDALDGAEDALHLEFRRGGSPTVRRVVIPLARVRAEAA